MGDDPSPELPLARRFAMGLALYASVMAIYFATGSIARPPWVPMRSPLDDLVPFVPAAMLGYGLVYVVPLSLLWLERTEAGVRRMWRAALAAYAIAAPFFVLLPVEDADPPLIPVSWDEHLLAWNRAADTSQNLFPSMHVGLATLLALVGARRSRAWGLALGAAAVVIAASTLLVKQHYVVDLPAGAIVGWLGFRIAYAPHAAARGGVDGEPTR